MKRVALAVLVMVLVVPLLGYVWAQNGHRVVGEIAQRHLTDEAARRVAELLDGESLAAVSTWADEIRADTSWSCAAPFHYVTVPPNESYFDHVPGEGDALTAIVFFESVLTGTTATREQRQHALKFLVHLVGDLHQPLHVGKGCDLGGNRVQVSWFGETRNLHSVWDEALVAQQNLSFSEMVDFVDAVTDEQIRSYQRATPLEWLDEAQPLLDGAYTCYTGSRGGDRCPCFCGDCSDGTSTFGGCVAEQCRLQLSGQVELGYQYVYRNWPAAREQLLKGGARLAGMLNWIFSDDGEPPAEYAAMRARVETLAGWDRPLAACTRPR